MKKTLLFALGLGFVVSVNAQNNKLIKPGQTAKKLSWAQLLYEPDFSTPSTKTTTPINTLRTTPLVITNAAVCDSVLGCSGNAYGGFTRPGRQHLAYYPSLNTLTFIHRSGPTCGGDANTGYYRFDVSTNGGMSWRKNESPNGPLYEPPGPILGRYPSATIYNPIGNTVADSAYISWFGPSCGACSGTGDIWLHYLWGASQIGNVVNPPVQNITTFTANVASHGLIPESMSDANGIIWVTDMGYDGTDYTDTVMLSKGIWNPLTKMHDYTINKFYAPVMTNGGGGKDYVTSNVAFNSTGLTGYLTIIGNNSYVNEPDSSYYVIVYKTIDGGLTWAAPYSIDLDAADTPLNAACAGNCTAAFQLDGAVDNTGDLHLELGIGPWAGGGSIGTGAGLWGMFSIITDGVTNTMQLLDLPMTFRGTFGAITEDSRPQVAVSPNGDKVFYVWFDTDTALFQGTGNSNPNAIMRVYDVASATWGARTDLTTGTIADGGVTFGYVANIAGVGCGGPGTWQVHIGYQKLLVDDISPVELHYLCGVCYGLGVEELENSVFNITNAYPNPTSGTTTIEVDMKKGDNVTVEITNTIGEVVYSINKDLSAGNHKFTVDASKWANGMYFYTVKTKEFSATNKLIIE